MSTSKNILLLLKTSVFLIFIGRAWQHLFWDAPYRSFFWDENLLKPFIEGAFNIPWKDYVTSTKTDDFIQNCIRGNGFLYLLASLCPLTISKNNQKWLQIPIFIGGISLVLLSILLTKEKFYHIGQFFEHSIQFGLPFVFLLYFKNPLWKNFVLILKILVAITFFSHGLYAFGFYPVPGKFVDMVIQIFGISEDIAIIFLYIAGIMDFIVAIILLFIPKVIKYALWYAVAWGLLTAFARVVANFYIAFPWQSIHQNLYETVYRIPHGLTPFLILIAMNSVTLKFLRSLWVKSKV